MSECLIGLTGGIGSGKSTVADLFAALGIAVVDTDVIAHELTALGGAAIPELRAAFGDDIIKASGPNGEPGALDRSALRKRVFASADDKARLEAILHPRIRALAEARCAEATSAYVLLVVPLLVEADGWRGRLRRTLVVDCEEATQIARVMRRNDLTEAEVRAIMATQTSRSARLAVADDVIVNDGAPADLRASVERLHHKYSALCRR